MSQQVRVTAETFQNYTFAVDMEDGDILVYTKEPLKDNSDLRNLLGLVSSDRGGYWLHRARFATLNAFALRYALKGKRTLIARELGQHFASYADKIQPPYAIMAQDGKAAELYAPNLKVYRELFAKLGSNPSKNVQRLRLDKLIDLEVAVKNWHSKLPPIEIHKDLLKLNREPIPGYDGTLDSLKMIPIGALNIVRANAQNWKSLSKSKATMEEKLVKFKIATLHDLLFRLPRRYIDKSQPQLIDDLIEGESTTLVGKIASLSVFTAGGGGLRVTIEDSTKNKITCTFWRQGWLKSRFKIDDEVIITGAVNSWQGQLQLNGKTIEHFDDGPALPIVPVYGQSVTAGITSAFLLSAIRELLQRMGNVKLPTYFKAEGRLPYTNILNEFHTPSSLEAHREAVNAMAYYELVQMQLVILDGKMNTESRPGLSMRASDENLQLKAIEALPYELTNSQKRARAKLNARMAENTPTSSLLLADVGAGKTLVAMLQCLQAVDAGYQAVLIGPTDVLARQLFDEAEKICALLEDHYGIEVSRAFLGGQMKAAEKRGVQKLIKEGEVSIIVGTQALLSSTVKFHNLGLVVVDEQQKFGAEQRTKLLNARNDDKVPDIILQTATPIPRSTAQVYYGDIDPILMKDKPAGRLPIDTQWIEEDPVGILADSSHPMWLDVMNEAKKGNQTFVITPMVVDSGKVDAASVERAYDELSKSALRNLRVGYVHGQMKADEQREVMERFKSKKLEVLIASTVIEVGVNIPDATRMVVLSAERMGASSLHQIRGRVGRNSKPSRCYLVSLGKSKDSQERLQALVDYADGFQIAKADLKIRGEGTMFARNQSGRSEMIFANLAEHSDLIEEAREEAMRILRSPFREKALEDASEKFNDPDRLF